MKDEQFQSLITRRGQEACGPDSLMNADIPPHAEIENSTQAKIFLPGLLEGYLDDQSLPVKRDLAVVFADIADSTSRLKQRLPLSSIFPKS